MITIKSCTQIWFSSNYKTYYLFLIQLRIGLQVITCLVENIMGRGQLQKIFFSIFCYAITLHMLFLFLFLTELRATRISCPCPHLFTTSCLHSPPIPINCACAIIRKYIVVLKKFDECTTKTRGKEYHCILHSSSKNKREVRNQSGSVILQDDDNVLKVSLICTENQEKETD